MAWFNDLRLTWKVMGSLALLGGAMVLVGVLGLISTGEVAHEVSDSVRTLVPKVWAVGRTHQTMFEVVADLRGALLADDPKDVDDALADVAHVSEQNADAFSRYTSLPLSDEEQALVAKYESTHRAWLQAVTRAAAQAKLHTDEGKDAAIEIVEKDVMPGTEALDDILDSMR